MYTALIYKKGIRGKMVLIWESKKIKDRNDAITALNFSGYDIYNGEYTLFIHNHSNG
jgi:hypothetical protein